MAKMRNSLADLNDLLFEQLERITNDDITGEALDEEVKRSKAVNATAQVIVNSNQLILSAIKVRAQQVVAVQDEDNINGLLGSGEK